MPLDLDRPYTTREGGEAKAIPGPDGRLYGWHRSGTVISHGWWHDDGRFGSEPGHRWDLVNVPEKRTVRVWFNIYETSVLASVWKTREEADQYHRGDRIACIEREITYIVGEGLEP